MVTVVALIILVYDDDPPHDFLAVIIIAVETYVLFTSAIRQPRDCLRLNVQEKSKVSSALERIRNAERLTADRTAAARKCTRVALQP